MLVVVLLLVQTSDIEQIPSPFRFQLRVNKEGTAGNVERTPSRFRFRVHVDEDGTVTFSDRPSLEADRLLGLPCAHLDRACVQATLQQWALDPGHFYLTVREPYFIVPPLFGAHFADFGELIMRARHQDSLAPEKRQLLDRTRDLRIEEAQKTRPARIAEALDALAARARAIWADDSTPLSERRLRLFQIWDECEEDTRAGAMARHLIERIIREVAPAGSERAFSDVELRDLNRQRGSKTHFAPYD